MKRRLISMLLALTFVFLLFPAAAFAAEPTLPSGLRDDEVAQAVSAYIEAHKDTTAAVSVAVFRGEETICQTAYGYANIEKGLAADNETVYEWGSITKLLVWVSAMQLWEQGRLSLEEDIRTYLPEGFLTRLKYDAPITMRNLMNHNAGWEDVMFQMCAPDAGSVLPLDEALRATEPAQVYRPGDVCAYSNWGVTLAGYIVERVSGQPFYEYVQEHIFRPLGMTHSSVSPVYSDNPWVMAKLQEGEGYSASLAPLGDGLYYTNLYPAGAAAGTLGDLLTFAKALVPGGKGASLLFEKSGTLTEMLSPTLTYPGTDAAYVCHGLWVHEFKVQALGHGGNTNMYSSNLLFDPDSGVGMVIMTNQSGELIYNYGLPETVFGKPGEAASSGVTSRNAAAGLSDMAGLYYSARVIRSGVGKIYTLLSLRPLLDRSGKLELFLFGLYDLDFTPAGPNTLIMTRRMGTEGFDMVARYSESGGTRMLSSLYGDMIEANADVWAVTAAFLLLLIAALWGTASLLIWFVRFILRKLRKRKREKDVFKKYHLLLCAAIPLLVVNILSVAGIMLSEKGTAATLMPHIIASIVLGILPVVYAALLAINWRRLVCGKARKAAYIITLCMGFVMTFSVLALELYKL